MVSSLLTAVAIIGFTGASVSLYLLPVLVGWLRRAPDLGTLAVINVLLGWTFLGWVAALAMALRSVNPPQPTVHVVQHAAAPPLPPAPPAAGGAAGWAGPPGPPPARPQDAPPLVLPPHPPSPQPAGGKPPRPFGTGRS